MRRICTAALLVGVGLVAGCEQLPDIEAGVCGNKVLEPELGEFCDDDLEPEQGPVCQRRGEPNPCHYKCGAGDDCGEHGVCGKADNTCRLPSGKLAPPDLLVSFGADKMYTGDLDGDGNPDVVAADLLNLYVHYLDGSGSWLSSFEIPSRLTLPVVTELTRDEWLDIGLIAGDGLSILRGNDARTLSPTLYPALPNFENLLGAASVNALEHVDGDEIVGAVLREGKIDLVGVSLAMSEIPTLLSVPESQFSGLEGPIAAAKLTSADPCETMALAIKDREDLKVFRPCVVIPETPEQPEVVTWNRDPDGSSVMTIPLPDGRSTWGGVLFVDVDLDGDLDMLAGSRGVMPKDRRVEVLLFNGTTFEGGIALPIPIEDAVTLCGRPEEERRQLTSFPIAMGDLDRDGKPELADENGIFLVSSDVNGRGRFTCSADDRWKSAYLGDLNWDGAADIAVASAFLPILTVFTGTESGVFTSHSYAMEEPAPIKQVLGGDFNGDQVGDLAVVQEGAMDPGGDKLSVLFGNVVGGPEEPVSIGRLGQIQQIDAGYTVGGDGTQDLTVVSKGGAAQPMSLSLLAGDPTGWIQSPFLLVETLVQAQEPSITLHIPSQIAAGRFDGDKFDDFAVLTRVRTQDIGGLSKEATIWLAGGGDAATLTPEKLDTIEDYDAMFRNGIALIPMNKAPLSDAERDGDALVVFARGDYGTKLYYIEDLRAEGELFSESNAKPLDGLNLSLPGAERAATPLFVGDVDGDQKRDIALTTDEGNIVIFWSTGGLDPSNRSVLEIPDVASDFRGPPIRDITFLDLDGAAPLEVVYLADSGLRAGKLPAQSTAEPQLIETLDVLGDEDEDEEEEEEILATGRSLLAFDANRDGVMDIAVGTGDSIFVLRGIPGRPE